MKAFMSSLLAAVLMIGCSPGLPVCKEPCQACIPEVIETFVLDKNFSPEQEKSIRDGAAMWNVATQGRVSYSFWIGTPSYEWPSVRCVQNELDPSYFGMTRKPFIDIEADRIEPDLVAGVAAHEFGHWLGLGHSKDQNDLMYPLVHDGMVITSGDLEEFRKIYP